MKFLAIISTLTLLSCKNNETAAPLDPNAIYFDYRIWGDENDENVTVFIQYRMSGKNGASIVLKEPAKVLLDGEELKVDSAKRSGAYYEIEKPLKEFEGKHEIIFTNLNKKEYKEQFDFSVLELKSNLPAEISRGDLAFVFDGAEENDLIRIFATDTSFRSRDINEIDTVKNGRVIVKADQLKNLVNGPVTLQLSKEMEKPIRNGTRSGGRLSISYGIQREFVLKD